MSFLKCGACGKSGQLKKCSRCQIVYYCNRECQLSAYPEHKNHCVKAMQNTDIVAAQSKVSQISKTCEVDSDGTIQHTFTLRDGMKKTLLTGAVPDFLIIALPLDLPVLIHCDMIKGLKELGYTATFIATTLLGFIKTSLCRRLEPDRFKKRLAEFGPVSKRYFLAATQEANGMTNESAPILNTMDALIVMKVIDQWANNAEMYSLIEKTHTDLKTPEDIPEVLKKMPNWTGRRLTVYFKLVFPTFSVFTKQCLDSNFIRKHVTK